MEEIKEVKEVKEVNDHPLLLTVFHLRHKDYADRRIATGIAASILYIPCFISVLYFLVAEEGVRAPGICSGVDFRRPLEVLAGELAVGSLGDNARIPSRYCYAWLA